MNESDKKNKRRILRAIEIILMYPRKMETQSAIRQLADKTKNCNILKIGLTAPRQVLYKKIDTRLDLRFSQGLIEEAEYLYRHGLSLKRMKQLGLEYGILANYLEGKITKDEMVNILKISVHQFAKRQLTWFKKEEGVNWFDITSKDYLYQVAKLVLKWYYLYDEP